MINSNVWNNCAVIFERFCQVSLALFWKLLNSIHILFTLVNILFNSPSIVLSLFFCFLKKKWLFFHIIIFKCTENKEDSFLIDYSIQNAVIFIFKDSNFNCNSSRLMDFECQFFISEILYHFNSNHIWIINNRSNFRNFKTNINNFTTRTF